MEAAYFLLVLLVLFVVFVLPVWAMMSASSAKSRVELVERELEALRSRLARMEQGRLERSAAGESGGQAEKAVVLPPPRNPAPAVEVIRAAADDFVREYPPIPPLLPIAHREPDAGLISAPVGALDSLEEQRPAAALPQPPCSVGPALKPEPPPMPVAALEARSALSLEQFMGVKLFAWVGGLALFFGVILFVKLSIERGWISPELRTVTGLVIGAGLVAAGWVIQRKQMYAVLAHTLCATGVVVLYGVTFAAHSLYRIPPFDHALATFAAMSLITAAAFWLSVRLNAQVVAVLGMLGGFLTPILCSTGQDNPLGLFSYIALLDLGVLSVAQRKRWGHLTPLAALGTLVMQLGWWGTFFGPSHYAAGAAVWIPMGVFLGFALLFSIAAGRMAKDDPDEWFVSGSAYAMLGSAMLAAFAFLAYQEITERPLVLYAFVGVITWISMGLAWFRPAALVAVRSLAGLTFAHLGIWTMSRLTPDLLPPALGVYLAFGLLHTGFAIAWQRRHGTGGGLSGWMPLASLLLTLIPVGVLNLGGPLAWSVVLVVNLLVIGLAARSGGLLPVLAALVLTVGAVGAWFFGHPLPPVTVAEQFPQFLIVLGGFAFLFAGAGTFLASKFPEHAAAGLLPSGAAVLPFPLLILTILRLPLPDPSLVFGLAAVLAVFLLGLARFSGALTLGAVALGAVTALQWVWQVPNFNPAYPVTPLAWFLGFYGLFTIFPFVFRRHFETERMPWIVSALAGLGTFFLLFRLVGAAWQNDLMGLLPAAFAIAPLAGLVYVAKRHELENPSRLSQLAWFGGVVLFFITLIIPVQFEKQWITLGWALEGAALCWLFRRVPHPGLRGLGSVLLGLAFVRLALNPAVLSYQISGALPIWNWQLYTYGLAVAALFAAASALSPPRHLWGNVNLRAAFRVMGGILAFLLLNIEIADAFTPAGNRSVVFEFDGNFARDMTYTISWALFSLGLMVLGLWKHHAPTRYAGIALLALALVKLFLRDLASIGSGYRIGAFIAVAVIALAASWLYQRFLNDEKP